MGASPARRHPVSFPRLLRSLLGFYGRGETRVPGIVVKGCDGSLETCGPRARARAHRGTRSARRGRTAPRNRGEGAGAEGRATSDTSTGARLRETPPRDTRAGPPQGRAPDGPLRARTWRRQPGAPRRPEPAARCGWRARRRHAAPRHPGAWSPDHSARREGPPTPRAPRSGARRREKARKETRWGKARTRANPRARPPTRGIPAPGPRGRRQTAATAASTMNAAPRKKPAATAGARPEPRTSRANALRPKAAARTAGPGAKARREGSPWAGPPGRGKTAGRRATTVTRTAAPRPRRAVPHRWKSDPTPRTSRPAPAKASWTTARCGARPERRDTSAASSGRPGACAPKAGMGARGS